jgi:hypothetical protein
MTTLLERAFAAARTLPDDMQDEAARAVLSYLGEPQQLFELTADDVEAVRRSRDAYARGEIASDAEMQAIWAKHGL